MIRGLKRKLYYIVKDRGPIDADTATVVLFETTGWQSTKGSVFNTLKLLVSDGSLRTKEEPVSSRTIGRPRRYFQAVL